MSCYLSQELVPLTPEGHGRFMRNCIEANQDLVAALQDRFSEANAELTLRPFHPPETVAYCFVLAPDTEIESIEALNELTNRIWRRMTVDGREDINQYSFLLSRTEVSVAAYEHVLDDFLAPDVLADALRQSKPFRNFRKLIDSSDYCDQWFAHRKAQYQQYVIQELLMELGDE